MAFEIPVRVYIEDTDAGGIVLDGEKLLSDGSLIVDHTTE